VASYGLPNSRYNVEELIEWRQNPLARFLQTQFKRMCRRIPMSCTLRLVVQKMMLNDQSTAK